MKPLLTADSLFKRYGNIVAVDNISFEIYPGEIFGFLAGSQVYLNDILPTATATRALNKILNYDSGLSEVLFELTWITAVQGFTSLSGRGFLKENTDIRQSLRIALSTETSVYLKVTSAPDRDSYIPFFVTFINISVSFHYLIECIAPVNNRPQVTCFNKTFKEYQRFS
jgi:hypothetical protein